jgi:hypothetical protein
MPRTQFLHFVAVFLASASLSPATTLLKLSLDQMIDQSTAIVRGKVSSCESELRGGMIHTVCALGAEERLKGPATLNRFSVPGGALRINGRKMRQLVAGTPEFVPGQEYVLFLWTGPKGVTELIGLSQGVLEVKQALGARMVERTPAQAVTLLDNGGHEVADQGVRLTLDALRDRVRSRQGASR